MYVILLPLPYPLQKGIFFFCFYKIFCPGFIFMKREKEREREKKIESLKQTLDLLRFNKLIYEHHPIKIITKKKKKRKIN